MWLFSKHSLKRSSVVTTEDKTVPAGGHAVALKSIILPHLSSLLNTAIDEHALIKLATPWCYAVRLQILDKGGQSYKLHN